MGAKARILELLKSRVGEFVSIEQLKQVASPASEWARTIRTLVQVDGYDIVKDEKYSRKLVSLKPSAKNERKVSSKMRYQILQRDVYCQRCGKRPGQGIVLVVDHKIPSSWGGTDLKNNLWALCEECNTGKKNWFADVHSVVATEVMRQKSGSARLRKLFELSPNKPLEVSTLQAIAGTRDWTRTVRAIRSNKSMNISYTKSSDGTEYYTHNID